MDYVVYADVMLVWLFIVNYLTYYMTIRITNHKISMKKLIIWSLISSLILELFYIQIMYQQYYLGKFFYIILNLLLMMIFVRYILNITSWKDFTGLLFYNIICTLVIAGLLQLFMVDNPKLSLIIPITLVICLGLPMYILIFSTKYRKNIYPVDIIINTIKISTMGYMDTGNNLLDTYSKKPVIILDCNLIKENLPDNKISSLEKYIKTGGYQHISNLTIDNERLHPITYKTISNQTAMMAAFPIKELTVNKKYVYKNIVAALSPNQLSSTKEYKVLLNNNL